MSYEQGFLDALLLVEQLALKRQDKNFMREIEEILKELRSAIYEKRVERLKWELNIF